MRVGVDARHLPERRGVARYLQRTLAALAAGCPDDEWLALVPGRVPVGWDAPPGVELRRTALPGRAVFGLGAAVGRPTLTDLLGAEVDVAWLPAPAPIGLGSDVPYVVTVHDLSFEQRPGDFTAYERLWHAAGRLGAQARGAARVVVVSGATRDAVVERWRVAPERVDVVHPGAGAILAPAPPPADVVGAGPAERGQLQPPPVEGRPYLLFVGALEPRKAVDLLAGAYARARAAGLEADLVVAGDGRLRRALEGRPGVRLLGAVGDAEADALYRGALAVVLPSWIEGFGLPPLEGLARGVPAVVADLPVYDETLGAGALRFAPGDAAALAEQLLAVGRDEALRARLVEAGQAAIAPLTWDATARGVRAALAEAAGR
ncbi:MAG TPA: glycosyltransferase family 1 protein [Capillimicrobium sp.]|jgi:glycosyltransferase involved in cell wall biosynthesis